MCFKHLHNYLVSHNLITNVQPGFTPGDSADYQLVDLYNTFAWAIDDGKEVRVAFCDISKAFDRVWHRGMLFKLRCMGLSGPLLTWFASYLENRKQRVAVGGSLQKRSTEGCSKFKSPETRQVQERLVSTLERMQVPKWDRTRCPEE